MNHVAVCVSPVSLLGKNSLILDRQRLGKNSPNVARQRLGRNITAVTNTHATIEQLLDASFCGPRLVLSRTSCFNEVFCLRWIR
jgi:hypothetical protein